MELKAYYNIHRKVRLSPLLRYYTQTAANFFKGNTSTDFIFAEDGFASADDRLSGFHSTTYGFGIESDLDGKWNSTIDLARQETSFGLDIQWISAGVNYAF